MIQPQVLYSSRTCVCRPPEWAFPCGALIFSTNPSMRRLVTADVEGEDHVEQIEAALRLQHRRQAVQTHELPEIRQVMQRHHRDYGVDRPVRVLVRQEPAVVEFDIGQARPSSPFVGRGPAWPSRRRRHRPSGSTAPRGSRRRRAAAHVEHAAEVSQSQCDDDPCGFPLDSLGSVCVVPCRTPWPRRSC